MARDQLHRLLALENLSPLTDDPEEWQDHGPVEEGNKPLYQNKRNSACFSNDGGTTYYSVNEPRDENGLAILHTSARIRNHG